MYVELLTRTVHVAVFFERSPSFTMSYIGLFAFLTMIILQAQCIKLCSASLVGSSNVRPLNFG